ncbi:putative glutamamyl carboxypeptidase [Trypanosoma cruzi]|uniref:Putative glutamamyl carboxypeptidase n=1 Tax=Trypanosoma cruzi TaxID=5693 RepID=A0A2V2UYG6_TRYCR|nr:putative glutamamyl carboxypeptidase [Trypanosoma cruzi]
MAARSMDHTQWLAKLVAFDTTSRNSNLELIHYCKDYLEGLGVKCTLLHNAERNKANLWRRCRATRRDERAASFSPATRTWSRWTGRSGTSDPFTLTERDGETVRSRHVRHEGLCCRVHVSGPRAPQDEAREADPLCVVVRRGGELSRRHGAGGVCAGPRRQGGRLHHWGADRHDCGDCSQGTSHFWVRVRGKAAHSSLALTGESCTPSTTPQNSLRSCARLRRSTAGTAPGMTSRCRSQRCRRTSSVAATPRTPCPRSASSSSSFERFPTRLSPR